MNTIGDGQLLSGSQSSASHPVCRSGLPSLVKAAWWTMKRSTISLMRFLSLDYDPVFGQGPDDDDTTRESFNDDTTVLDYDVAIWDPEDSFRRRLIW
jgi:hypothetical protein